jgi:prevent-host-death family protein
MDTVNIHKAKTQLSRLVDQAANGKSFIIAKAGKPLVKVTPLDTPTGKVDFNAFRRFAAALAGLTSLLTLNTLS